MRRARKYLAWLEEYGLTAIHRAQRIVLRRMLETKNDSASIHHYFDVENLVAEVEDQTGVEIKDKEFFIGHILDDLMLKAGLRMYLYLSERTFTVEIYK